MRTFTLLCWVVLSIYYDDYSDGGSSSKSHKQKYHTVEKVLWLCI